MSDHRLPLPFVTGALGLLLAYVLPGGLGGGEGFLVGFAVGVALPLLGRLATREEATVAEQECRCPKCGARMTVHLTMRSPPIGNKHVSERGELHE